MNNEKRIIRYLDNDCSDEEKIELDKELKSNADLRKLFENYSRVNNFLSESKNIENSGGSYFINLIPSVREKIAKESGYISRAKLKYVLPFILVFGVSYLIINTELMFNSTNVQTISEISDELDDSDLDGVLRFIDDTNEIFTSSLSSESYLDTGLDELEELINQIPETEYLLLADIASNNISSDITQEEAEMIYSELIIKKFKSEVKL